MPRKARLDIPGLLQHVIVRGIEKRDIFLDDEDRRKFCTYFSALLEETKTECFAWALIPNHFHLLLRPQNTELGRFMRRLLTRYAVNFNLRHNRVGHLFQNRYKSIVCEEETYLLELIRYIHLNPLRASLVPDLESLDVFSWSGHAVIMGNQPFPGQSVEKVLLHFGKRLKTSRKTYRQFVGDGVATVSRPYLVGGGLVRSREALGDSGIESHDDRVLGGDEFLARLRGEEALHERIDRKIPLPSLLEHVAKVFNVTPKEMQWRSRISAVSEARAVFCYAAIRMLGAGGKAVGDILSMGRPAVSRASQRGAAILEQRQKIRKGLENLLK